MIVTYLTNKTMNTQEIQEDERKIKMEINSILWKNTDVTDGNYPMKGQLKADLEAYVFGKLAEQEAEFKKTLNSGRKLYELGKKDAEAEIEKLKGGYSCYECGSDGYDSAIDDVLKILSK